MTIATVLEAERASDPVELTILMPCLNEAKTIGTCIGKAVGFLAGNGITGEVLIADNGSTDGSQDIARAAGARVVAVAEKGYGAALIGGIKAARGVFVIMGDADDSYDFSNLSAFVAALRGGADLVMGNRFQGGIAAGAMPPLNRWLGNPVLSWVGRIFFSVPIGDFHCGLRGFRRDAVLKLRLRTSGMEFASEMVVKASLAGLRIAEAPTTLSPDGRDRPPHLRPWRDGWRHLKFLLVHAPDWTFVRPGCVLSILGAMVTLILALLGSVRVFGVEFQVHTMLAAAMVFVVGVQSLSFGLLARQHAVRFGLLRPKPSILAFGTPHSVDRAMMLGAAMAALGVAGLGGAAAVWGFGGFGNLDYAVTMRIVVPSVALTAAGIQVALSGLLSGVIEAADGAALRAAGDDEG